MFHKTFLLIFTFFPFLLRAAEGGVSLTAEKAFMIGDFPITNSMITSWVISLFLILAIRIVVGKATLAPNGLVECLISLI